MRKHLLTLLCLLPISVCNAASDEFHCELANHKIVKISKSSDGSLHYQYGAENKPEMVLPVPGNKSQIVRYSIIPMAGGSASYVRFTNGNISYVMFEGGGLNWGIYTGLVVWQGKKILSQRQCVKTPDILQNFLEANNQLVKEDDENAMQYGYNFLDIIAPNRQG